MSTMTKTQYAKHRGVSGAMVSKMVRDERILVTPDNLVDVEISDTLLDKYSESPIRQDPEFNPDDGRDILLERLQGSSVGSYAEQRALLTKYKAGLAKIELDRASGTSLDAKATREAAFSLGRSLRDQILGISDRIAPIVAAESDTHKVRTILDTELRQALEDVSKTLESEYTEETIH